MLFVLLLLINPAKGVSVAAGPGVIIVNIHASQDFQEVDEYELVVQNTDTVPLQVHFLLEGDIDQPNIIDIKFGDNDFILQPNKERTIPVSFSVKTAGTYHGKILSSFGSVQELNETTGAGAGFFVTTKVTINAYGERPEGNISNVTVSDIWVNEPLVITAEFRNTGNVAALLLFSVTILKDREVFKIFE